MFRLMERDSGGRAAEDLDTIRGEMNVGPPTPGPVEFMPQLAFQMAPQLVPCSIVGAAVGQA